MTFKRKPYTRVAVTPWEGLRGVAPFSTGRTDAPEQPKEAPRKDPNRMAWFRRTFTKCQICHTPGGEPHHHSREGHGIMARTAPDSRVIWLCRGCHRHFHDHRRVTGRTPVQTQELFEHRITGNQAVYAAVCESGGIEPRIEE